jgi:hypothetical protein
MTNEYYNDAIITRNNNINTNSNSSRGSGKKKVRRYSSVSTTNKQTNDDKK